MKVVPVLKPGKSQGLVDVDLKVKDENPFHGSVALNNYNSADTSESRLSLGISYDNLWQKQHSFALQWQVAPQETNEANVRVATSPSTPSTSSHFRWAARSGPTIRRRCSASLQCSTTGT